MFDPAVLIVLGRVGQLYRIGQGTQPVHQSTLFTLLESQACCGLDGAKVTIGIYREDLSRRGSPQIDGFHFVRQRGQSHILMDFWIDEETV